MSIADMAFWLVVVLVVVALIYVHRPKVAAPTSAPTVLDTIEASVKADMGAGERAIEAYISKWEADAKAWAERTAQVAAVKEKVAAVTVPAPAAPVAR